MTRPSKRELSRQIADLKPEVGDGEGFRRVIIGGDPARATEESGIFRWNHEQGVYENAHGRQLPADAAPEPADGCNVRFFNDTTK